MSFCSQCGKNNAPDAHFCNQCGFQLSPIEVDLNNISSKGDFDGQAPLGASFIKPIPQGVKGWSWGAFFFNWIWAIFNKTWIGLLAFVPGLGFIMSIVLGIKGREWAWQNNDWDSVEHFLRVQRRWSQWAVGILLVLFIGSASLVYLAVHTGKSIDLPNMNSVTI